MISGSVVGLVKVPGPPVVKMSRTSAHTHPGQAGMISRLLGNVLAVTQSRSIDCTEHRPRKTVRAISLHPLTSSEFRQMAR